MRGVKWQKKWVNFFDSHKKPTIQSSGVCSERDVPAYATVGIRQRKIIGYSALLKILSYSD